MPNPPTVPQIQQLHVALLDAFTIGDLEKLARIKLEIDLETIVPTKGRTRDQVAYDLIRVYAARKGGFVELMHAARQANDTNQRLSKVVTLLSKFDYAVLPQAEVVDANIDNAKVISQIQTDGGAVTQGGVNTNGGDFVGRDKLTFVVQDQEEAQRLLYKRQQQEKLRNGTFDRLPFEPETVLIPAGSFLMGSDDDNASERPQHSVTLNDYRMGKYPVTNVEYAQFIKQTRQQAPPRSGWLMDQPPADKETHPVVNVSWEDARAYCDWLTKESGRSYRLPTEAEWEKAARGPTDQRYPWAEKRESWAETCVNLRHDTGPVDAFPDGVSCYGCFDLLGNAQEWTMTIWGSDENRNDFPYSTRESHEIDAARNDPDAATYPAHVYRVHRGGSCRSRAAEIRVTARGRSVQQSKSAWRGFRVMIEI